MPARTVAEHVEALLSRQVTEGKISGAPRPDLEAASVFDSIAMTLVLQPRAALYFALLARNGLVATIQDELAVLDSLTKVVADLGNASFQIEGVQVLRRAYSALTNLETLPSLDSKTRTTSISVSLYGKAVTEFLNNYLAKNVKQRGSTDLIRPGQEASQDMPTVMQTLRDDHEELLARLDLLLNGIANFDAAPFGAILSSATVSRAKADLEEIISNVEGGGSPSQSRDFAVRLIGSKAAISTISAPPKWGDTLLPAKTVGTSASAAAEAVTQAGPFYIDVAGPSTLALEVCGQQGSFYFIPGRSAVLVGESISFPLTVAAGYGLFVTTVTSGMTTEHRIDMAGTYADLGQLVTKLSGQIQDLYVAPFASSASRLMLYSSVFDEISIQAIYNWPEGGVPGITAPVAAISTNSVHDALGFYAGQAGTSNVSAHDVAEAIQTLFPSLATFVDSDAQVHLVTTSTAPGAYIKVLTCPTGLGLSGVYRATSTDVVLGPNVSDHRLLMQAGDLLRFPDAFAPGTYLEAAVSEVLQEKIVLGSAVPTFSAVVTATSSVVSAYLKMMSALRGFLITWASSPFASGVDRIDRALAPLITSQSPAQRNTALAEIQPLQDQLTLLLNLLNDDSTMLPVGSGQGERKTVEGILTTLAERHFLRAADLLLKCDLQSLLGMNVDDASYGGAFLSASATFARNNFQAVDIEDTTEPTGISAGHN